MLICALQFLVKTWNGEKSSLDREAEQDRHSGMKRTFDDEYNEDFDRGVVSILFKLSKKRKKLLIKNILLIVLFSYEQPYKYKNY